MWHSHAMHPGLCITFGAWQPGEPSKEAQRTFYIAPPRLLHNGLHVPIVPGGAENAYRSPRGAYTTHQPNRQNATCKITSRTLPTLRLLSKLFVLLCPVTKHLMVHPEWCGAIPVKIGGSRR